MLLALKHANESRAVLRGRTILFAVSVLACTAALSAQIAPLTGDAYVDSSQSTTNFGALPFAHVGSNQKALLQFDLTKLPTATASQVTGATLRLFIDKVNTTGSFNLSSANGSWSESTVTSNTGIGASTTIQSGVPVSVANAYIVLDVTTQVQAWINGTTNNGFIVTSVSGDWFFDTKENRTTSH